MDSLPPPKRTFYGPPPGLDVAERPPDPRAPEARKAPEAPTLPAYVTDHQAYVWCRYCCFFHEHGRLDGLRVAHCEFWSGPNYEGTSYRLETVGLWTRDLAAYGVPLSLEQICTVRPVCQRMPAISLSDGVPLTGKIGQKRARRPGEYAFSGNGRTRSLSARSLTPSRVGPRNGRCRRV